MIIIGTIGATLTLAAFLGNQFNKLKNDSALYDLLNLIASIFLIAYAISVKGYPFIVLNTIWGLVSLKDVLKYIIVKYNIKFQ